MAEAQKPNIQKIRYNKLEAAERLSLNLRTLNYRLAAGAIGCVRDGKRVFILHEEIERYGRMDHLDPIVPTV